MDDGMEDKIEVDRTLPYYTTRPYVVAEVALQRVVLCSEQKHETNMNRIRHKRILGKMEEFGPATMEDLMKGQMMTPPDRITGKKIKLLVTQMKEVAKMFDEVSDKFQIFARKLTTKFGKEPPDTDLKVLIQNCVVNMGKSKKVSEQITNCQKSARSLLKKHQPHILGIIKKYSNQKRKRKLSSKIKMQSSKRSSKANDQEDKNGPHLSR